MLTLKLSPLNSRVASVLAEQRKITVGELIVSLLHEEAAIELAHWRSIPKTRAPDVEARSIAVPEGDLVEVNNASAD